MTEIKSLKDAQSKVWRFGRGMPWCEGMTPDIDPQNLPPQNPYLLINTRIEGGVPSMRPGSEQICNLGGSVSGIWDHQLGTERALYLSGDGCPGISPTVGAFISKYDTELRQPAFIGTTSFVNVAYFDTVANNVFMGLYSDQIYFGKDALIQRLGEVSRLALPTGYSNVTAFMEHEGVLLIAAKGTAASGVGTSAIFTFDGITLTNELTAINPVIGFGKYRDKCAAIFNGTPNSIRVRSSAGVWSAPIAPGAGTVAVVGPDVCASYKDKLYIPNGDEDIFSFDQASTLTQIPIATTGISAGGHVMSVVSAFGYLYYAWHDAALTTVKIGRFDGTTWNASYKDLTGQGTWSGSASDPPVEARAMKLYRGDLALACRADPGGGSGLYFSPLDAVSGTWTRITTTTTGDWRQLLVF